MDQIDIFFSNKNYERTSFSDISFDEEKLVSSEFTECSFKDMSFMNSELSNIIFEKCTFHNVNFSNCKLPNSSFQDCMFEGCKMIGIDMKLMNNKLGLKLECTACDLSYSFITDMDISESTFKKCKLHEIDLTNTKAKKCIFTECDLQGARFIKTDLSDTDMSRSHSFYFDPSVNKCKGLKISRESAENLLTAFGVIIGED